MRWVTFSAHEIGVTCRVRLSGPVVPVQHAPEGWQAIQRMWRTSFTEWQGAAGWELTIPVIFDRVRTDPSTGLAMQSVESNIRNLERMAEKMSDQPRPPILRIDAGGAVPHDHTNDHTKQWVIAGQALSWGDYMINGDGKRCRQDVTVMVWEYMPDKLVQVNNLIPTKPVPKTYHIKKGDTLMKIAAYFYGDSSKWRKIASFNRIRDPNHLKVGRIIRLPAS